MTQLARGWDGLRVERKTAGHPDSLADYIRLLKRRKWVFIATALAVPAMAVALSLKSPPTYEGSAKVLLTSRAASAHAQGAIVDPARAAQTQADLARVQEWPVRL